MRTIKLILDESINDRTFANSLVTYKYNFEFNCMLFMCSIAEILIKFCTHFFDAILKYQNIIYLNSETIFHYLNYGKGLLYFLFIEF